MGKKRNTKIFVIVSLVFSIFAMSLGFAAFSNILTISSSVTVKPSGDDFQVLFSSSESSQVVDYVVPDVSGGATGENASISGTTISGLKANFTAPGQSVSYKFWVRNSGSYDSYLNSIIFMKDDYEFKSCIYGDDVSENLGIDACDNIILNVSIGDINTTDTISVSNHILGKGDYEQIIVTITYLDSASMVDGDLDVTFGDIKFEYGSADSYIINFSVNGISYQALAGMTWGEWVNSEYNVDGFYIVGEEVCSPRRNRLLILETDLIISGEIYEFNDFEFCGGVPSW